MGPPGNKSWVVKCPTHLNNFFSASISVQGTADLPNHPFVEATVTYTFVRSDGKPDNVRTLVFKKTKSDLSGASVGFFPPSPPSPQPGGTRRRRTSTSG